MRLRDNPTWDDAVSRRELHYYPPTSTREMKNSTYENSRWIRVTDETLISSEPYMRFVFLSLHYLGIFRKIDSSFCKNKWTMRISDYYYYFCETKKSDGYGKNFWTHGNSIESRAYMHS